MINIIHMIDRADSTSLLIALIFQLNLLSYLQCKFQRPNGR